MASIIKNNFRLRQAKDFLEGISGHPIVPPALSGSHAVDRNHYLFVGRPRPWPNNIVEGTNELAPPVPQDNPASDFDLWDSILGFKKITDVFSTLVIPRYNWDSSGETIYAPYDDKDPNLFHHPTPDELAAANLAGDYKAGSHWVLTDEFHVFKCLSNNNGAKSTVKPTLPLTPPYIVSTADGYQWKYMCSVSPAQVLKFLSESWIPVKTLGDIADDGSTQWDVEQNATDGSIDSFLIENVGSGYLDVLTGTLVSATPTTATLPPSASGVTGAYVGASIFITAGTGFPSSPRKILTYDGTTKVATLDAPWTADGTTEFEIWPTVEISGNGTGATAKLEVHTSGPDLGKIKQIVMTSVGSGYTFASAVISGGGGSGGVVRPVISPKGGHGKDVERELGAFFAMLDVRLAYNEGNGDFPLANDYRVIGIVRDLLNFDGTLANADTRIASKSIKLTAVSSGLGGPFQPDEDIIGILGGDTAQAKIVDFVSGPGIGEGTIYFWQDPQTGFNDFLDSMVVTGQISGATGTIQASGVVEREVRKNSGDIIYVEHRRPVLRAPDQIEDIKVIIEF